MPARGLLGRVPGLASHALAPRTVRDLVEACTLVGSLYALPLPTCGLGSLSHSLRTAPGAVRFTCALGVTARVLDESTRALLAAAGPAVTVRAHAGPDTGPMTVRGHWISLSSPLTGLGHWSRVGGLGRSHRDRVEAHGVSQDRGNSGSRVGSTSAVSDGSLPWPEPYLRDPARLFLSLSGSREQWDAVVGSAFSVAAVSGAGSLP